VDPTLNHPSPQDGKPLQLHALSCTGAFEIRGPNSAVSNPELVVLLGVSKLSDASTDAW